MTLQEVSFRIMIFYDHILRLHRILAVGGDGDGDGRERGRERERERVRKRKIVCVRKRVRERDLVKERE